MDGTDVLTSNVQWAAECVLIHGLGNEADVKKLLRNQKISQEVVDLKHIWDTEFLVLFNSRSVPHRLLNSTYDLYSEFSVKYHKVPLTLAEQYFPQLCKPRRDESTTATITDPGGGIVPGVHVAAGNSTVRKREQASLSSPVLRRVQLTEPGTALVSLKSQTGSVRTSNYSEVPGTELQSLTMSGTPSLPPKGGEGNEQHDRRCTLVVEDLPSDLPLDELELYFEAEEYSGGGEIENTSIKKAQGKAIIEFQDPQAVDRILRKGRHTIGDREVSVKRWQPPCPPAPKKTRSIKVTHFKPGTKKDILDMFFANKKKSGGGAVDNIEIHGDYCIVTFRTDEGYEGVLSRDTLRLSGHTLQVQPYYSEAHTEHHLLVSADGDTWSPGPKNISTTPVYSKTSSRTETESVYMSMGGTRSQPPEDESEYLSMKYRSGGQSLEDNKQPASSLTEHGIGSPAAASLDGKALRASQDDVSSSALKGLGRGAWKSQPQRTERKVIESMNKLCMVELTGLPRYMDQTRLLQYLAKAEQTANVVVVDCSLFPSDGRALIQCQSPIDAEWMSANGKLQLTEDLIVDAHWMKDDEQQEEFESPDGQSAQFEDPPRREFSQRSPSPEWDAPAQQGPNAACMLEITGIPAVVTKEALHMYLENKRVTGGTDVENLQLYPEEGRAVAIFSTVLDAEKVSQLKQLQYFDADKTLLKLRWMKDDNLQGARPKRGRPSEFDYPAAMSATTRGRQRKLVDNAETPHVERKEDNQADSDEETATIIVSGLKTSVSSQLLSLYFESPKVGGGDIKEMKVDKLAGTAMISFKDSRVAQSVIKRKHLIEETEVQVAAPSKRPKSSSDDGDRGARSSQDIVKRSVIVEGIQEGMSQEMLCLLFENSRRSGGGEIEDVDFQPQQRKAVITFVAEEVALRVAGKGTVNMDKTVLRIKPMDPAANITAPSKSTTSRRSDQPRIFSVEVRDLPDSADEESVRMFFENTRRSGGGDVKKVSFDAETRTAVVTFHSSDDAERVLGYASREDLVFDKAKLSAVGLDIDDAAVSGGSKAIVVTGYKTSTSEDVLMLFFESRKRSGGGDVEEMTFSDDRSVLYITFRAAEVVPRILQKCPLSVDGKQLRIERMTPKVTALAVQGPIDKDKVLLKGVSSKATIEELKQYIAKSGCAVKAIAYGTEPGIVLVIFKNNPDLGALKRLCYSQPLKDSMPAMQKVATPDSVQVHNVGKSSEDALTMYFESTRGGGEDVVSTRKSGDCVIVQFNNPKVVEEVAGRKHTFEGNMLGVRVFFDSLGVIPPGHDTSTPSAWIPSRIELSNVPEKILEFILHSSAVQTRIESMMEKVDTEVDWPLQPHGDVLLNCTLRQGSPDLVRKARKWESLANQTFNDLLQTLGYRSISSLQQLWDRIQKEVKAAQAKLQKSALLVKFDKKSTTIHIMGLADKVNELADLTESMTKHLEAELLRSEQIITEDLSLKKFQILLLLAAKFTGREEAKYTDMKIEADVRGSKLSFHGLPNDIIASKVAMYELLNDVKQETIDVSEDFAKLVKGKAMRTELVTIMKQQPKEWIAVWDAKDKGIIVHALSDDDLANTVRMLRTEVVEKPVDVQDGSLQCLESQGWKDLQTKLLHQHSGLISIKFITDRQVIIIITLKALIELITEDVVNFLTENTTLEQFLKMDFGTARLMKQFMKNKLKSICEKASHDKALALPMLKKDRPGILVKGSSTALRTIIPKLRDLVNDIIVADHQVDAPGMPQYFAEEKGKQFLDNIENRFKVAIEIAQDDAVPSSPSEGSFHMTPVIATVISKVSVEAGRSIVIVHGDITEYPVDAIVNAANAELEHCGGVARAIVDKGGPVIQDECRRYISKNGRLLTGQVFVSGAGRLQCKKVVHTVGPVWKGGFANEENELYEAVHESLTAAGKNKCKSVALPAISSGVFGFPLSECARIILDAVKDALSDGVGIKQVHLIDPKMKLVNSFHEAAVKLFGKSKVVLESSASGGDADTSGRNRDLDRAGTVAGSKFTATAAPGSLKTPEGLIISNVQAVITKQQVDVIVNTTSKDLNLNNGAVSALILKDAGPTIQMEASAQTPINFGDVIATSPGNLPCNAIFHGACVGIKDAKCEQIFRLFVSNCLTKADGSKYTAIAFPAIGTGNLGIPRPDVARWMFEEVIKFSKNNPASTVKAVNFILYSGDQDTVKAFDEERQGLIESGGKKRMTRALDRGGRDTPAAAAASSRPYGPPQMYHASENQRTMYPGAVGGAPMAASSHQMQMKIGTVVLQVQQGDICEEKTDAIINSTNRNLDLSIGAVSQAIVHRGGRSIMDECKQIGKTDKNGIAVTSAGSLHCDYIIHVEAGAKPWKELVRNSLKAAEKQSLESLSMPALGTGNFSRDAAEIASSILDGISTFVTSDRPRSLKLVRITVFQPHMVKPFHEEMNHRADSAKNKGLWSRIMAGVFGASVYGDVSEQGFKDRRIIDQGEIFNPNKTGVKDKLLWEDTDNIYGDVNTMGAAGGRPRGASMEEILQASRLMPEQLHASQMTLQIYADSQPIVDKVCEAIDKVCKEEVQEYIMDKAGDQESIKNLNEGQIAKIERLQENFQANIKIERGTRLNRIRFQCNKNKQADLISEIYTILREVDEGAREDEHADMISKQVRWEFNNGDTFEEYPPNINVIIEKAYLGKDDMAQWQEKDDRGQKVKYRIDFKKMEEFEVDKAGTQVPVRRVTPGGRGIALPGTWTPMADTETYKKVLLANADTEFQTVKNNFTTSMAGSAGTVMKIERIQNRSLYQRYAVHKEEMERVNAAGLQNERTMWHGTSVETLEPINAQGFNRSYCGKNATALGNGVYFAVNANYSAQQQYSRPDPTTGHRHMYQAKVLCGEMTRGAHSMKAPPVKTAPATLFDAVADNPASPSIVVIFSDTQAYPEYLVTFT